MRPPSGNEEAIQAFEAIRDLMKRLNSREGSDDATEG